MNILLKNIDRSETVQLECELYYSIKHVKSMFEEKHGVSPDRLLLAFAGKRLENQQSLSECGIVEGAILHFVFR